MLTLTPAISDTAAAAAYDPSVTRWEELRRDDLRVASVTYHLALANRRFCSGTLAPQFGFVPHSIDQYGPAERDEAARILGLGARVGVMAVIRNSPAALAGLRAGDQLMSVNGRDLASVDATRMPTNASVKAARQIMLAEMEKGAVTLRVSGPAGDREVRFAAEAGCPANVELVPGSTVNAWADGEVVVVSAGLLERCDTDDDLALVIAHELSHNLLHHSARLALAGIGKSGLLQSGGQGSAEMRRTEEEADALAVRLATAAGYDLRHAGAFMGGLLTRSGMDHMDATHPAPALRLALLSAAIARARATP